MAQEEYDFILDVKKRVNVPYKKYYQQAKAASESGKLKLVNEIILEPYNGKGFELKKGQVVRYEMTSGAQIIDTFYMVKSRPMEEWADTFHTSGFGSHTQWEGDHYYSNSPFTRPLLTLIRDTVDNENLKKVYGERAAHSYVLHNGACSSGVWEAIYGTVDSYSCHVGLAQGMLEIAGEEVARRFIHPAAFMHFQAISFDKIPTALTYFSGRDVIKPGDFVELLAHEDLYVAISPCPLGDQNDMTAIENCVCYPVRIAIYEGEDGPLETAPDPERKTMNAVDFVKAGRPGMVVGKIGKKD
jgi:uncharacterized protein YcgI (DUF1989 family)